MRRSITAVVLALALWPLSLTPTLADISYTGAVVDDTFIGSSTSGPNTDTVSCPDGSIAIGVEVHARPFLFRTTVSGLKLICTKLSNTGAMPDGVPTFTTTAGRSSVNNQFTERYPRICPTGQILSGLRGRAGAVVDAISIRCTEFRPNVLTGAVTQGQDFNIGAPIFGSGGSPDSSFCNGDRFVHSITVEFGDVADRLRTHCAHLRTSLLGNQNSQSVDLTARSNNQRIVFNGLGSPDGFSVVVHNLGRTIPANVATVILTLFSNTDLTELPSGCTQTGQVLTCPVRNSIARGGRAFVSGFEFRPESTGPFSDVFEVEVSAAGDVDASNDSHIELVLAPNIFFP